MTKYNFKVHECNLISGVRLCSHGLGRRLRTRRRVRRRNLDRRLVEDPGSRRRQPQCRRRSPPCFPGRSCDCRHPSRGFADAETSSSSAAAATSLPVGDCLRSAAAAIGVSQGPQRRSPLRREHDICLKKRRKKILLTT